jgi:hypothetical protein
LNKVFTGETMNKAVDFFKKNVCWVIVILNRNLIVYLPAFKNGFVNLDDRN